jgi:hypothetical protein
VPRNPVPGKPEESPQPELDVPAVLSALQRHGVEYLLVGGLAARVYGATRPTQGFDCLVRRGTDNLDRRLRYEVNEPRAGKVHCLGFTTRAASLGDIVASKKWANRPKDRSALPELYRLLAGKP